jgi:hypothetical protein
VKAKSIPSELLNVAIEAFDLEHLQRVVAGARKLCAAMFSKTGVDDDTGELEPQVRCRDEAMAGTTIRLRR